MGARTVERKGLGWVLDNGLTIFFRLLFSTVANVDTDSTPTTRRDILGTRRKFWQLKKGVWDCDLSFLRCL
jgi:hypothetical protein